MISVVSGKPAGRPSRIAVSAGPCDSPAVRKRRDIIDLNLNYYTLLIVGLLKATREKGKYLCGVWRITRSGYSAGEAASFKAIHNQT
jgi:hypothetical protein